VVAVGYNALAGNQFEEKVYMYRFWSAEVLASFPIDIYKGTSPDKTLLETDKAITNSGLIVHAGLWDASNTEPCFAKSTTAEQGTCAALINFRIIVYIIGKKGIRLFEYAEGS
jgi:hypothetical protein